MKRLFVGVVFDDAFRNYLADLQHEVVKVSDKGKFHSLGNLHLTIEFIGMVPEELIDPMWQAIISRLDKVNNFMIRANHLGVFHKKNKVIPWVGLEDQPVLKNIQREVALGVADVIDHVISHDYTPHITLGRQVVLEKLPDIHVDYAYQVREICLMESSSVSGSLTYKAIKRYPLKHV